MPQRPQTHKIADLAISKVVLICSELGWACETVQKDYGEDLWIQTTTGDKVDTHKIWLQVKATENIDKYLDKNNELNYPVHKNHLLRWVRNLELVVFILWDVKNDIGYWTIPSHSITDWDLLEIKKKSVKLFFDKANKFTKTTAKNIFWIAKIYHYNTLLAVAQPPQIQSGKEQDPFLNKKYKGRLNLIAFDFLREIGILEDNGSICNPTGSEFLDIVIEMLEETKLENQPLCVRASAILILKRIDKLCEYGIPELLFLQCISFLADLIISRLQESGLTKLHRMSLAKLNNFSNRHF